MAFKAHINLKWIYEVIRYAIAGLLATCVYFLLATFFYKVINMRSLDASTLAYILSGFVSYFTQKYFTFQVVSRDKSMAVRFIVLFILGLIINYILVSIFEKRNANPIFAFALVCAVIPAINYLIMKFWVFVNQ